MSDSKFISPSFFANISGVSATAALGATVIGAAAANDLVMGVAVVLAGASAASKLFSSRREKQGGKPTSLVGSAVQPSQSA